MDIATTYGFLIFLIAAASSCIDTIELKFKETDLEYLIVNAELRDNQYKHEISIKLNTNEARDFEANFPVSDAEVYLVKDGDEIINFKYREKGIYEHNGLILRPNSNYVINIIYKNSTYKSFPEKLEQSIPISELKTIVRKETVQNEAGNIIEKDFVHLLVDTQFPENKEVFLKYRVEGTYAYKEVVTSLDFDPAVCYVSELIDFDNISIASNKDLSTNNILKNHTIIKRNVDFRFATNYCMKVYQERISENAFQFWQNVTYEYQRTGDIFEKPPGIIRGNIIEQENTEVPIIGLFSIIAVDSLDFLITPISVDFPDSQCERFSFPPQTCTNCLLLNKSTLTKPECFQ